MRFYKGIIDEDNRYNYEKVEVKPNKWIREQPYAVEQNVMIQDYDDCVALAWVESTIVQDANGKYRVNGLRGGIGAKPVKCFMLIPFPFDDPTGWNSEYMYDDTEKPRKKMKQYLVCVENNEYGRTTYELRLSHYNPGRYSDWTGYNSPNGTRTVVAWREIPRPTRKKMA